MFQRMMNSLRRFFYGRNGTDQLNLVLISVGIGLYVIASIVYRFVPERGFSVLILLGYFLQLAADGLLIWSLFRALSRNLMARQRENRWLLQHWRSLTDRQNRYYRCPQCRQTVRVPRGRGKICIKCPRCGEKFVRKS